MRCAELFVLDDDASFLPVTRTEGGGGALVGARQDVAEGYRLARALERSSPLHLPQSKVVPFSGILDWRGNPCCHPLSRTHAIHSLASPEEEDGEGEERDRGTALWRGVSG